MKMIPKEKMLTFSFDSFDYDLEEETVQLKYQLSNNIEFSEFWKFPGCKKKLNYLEKIALEKAIGYLHIAAGISYFKTYCPPRIDINSLKLSSQEADFFQMFYEYGLGEFAYENNLNLWGKIKFPFSKSLPEFEKIKLPENYILPIGGGKDSIVSAEIVHKRRQGEKGALFSVGAADPIIRVMDQIGGEKLNIIRSLSPTLFQENEKGAFNGHVPISGILAFSMVIAGILYGFNSVVMSNERSANVGNTKLDGKEVNHQWSKSFEFEQEFSRLINENLIDNFQYFSLLRPLSEIHIISLFAKMQEYHYLFTSCNTSFKYLKSKDIQQSWCGNCPKCRFVFLCLAVFLDKKSLINIFGKNLLNDPSQELGFEQLLGLRDFKPFECVGEIKECQWAFFTLMKRPEWAKDQIILRLKEPLKKKYSQKDFDEDGKALFSPSVKHQIPNSYLNLLHSYLDA